MNFFSVNWCRRHDLPTPYGYIESDKNYQANLVADDNILENIIVIVRLAAHFRFLFPHVPGLKKCSSLSPTSTLLGG